MFNMIVSIAYLRALLSIYKAALQTKFGIIKPSDEVDDFCDKSDEDEIITRYASDWIFDMDGRWEAKFFVGQVPEGFILGSEESYMGGDCEVSWPSDKYYLDFEVAKSVLFNMIEEWIRGDIEQPVAHVA